jgi:thioredoxin reductase
MSVAGWKTPVNRPPAMYDVCIIGAGPAGLNAALILGRCLRDVIVFDSGQPRNSVSGGLHGFLSRDGVRPDVLRELGRSQLAPYETVRICDDEVVAAHRGRESFQVRPRHGDTIEARILLLATGRVDVLPDKPGFRELYGQGVYHCPYCDGWEHRQQPLTAYARGPSAVDFALELLVWSPHVTLCTDGPIDLRDDGRARLARQGVRVEERPIVRAEADEHRRFRAIRFVDGTTLDSGAVFFDIACPQKSPLAEHLGCALDDSGAVRCQGPASVDVPGLYVAGNVRCGLHLAITAAAEGVEAAVAINEALHERRLSSGSGPKTRVEARGFHHHRPGPEDDAA